MSRKFASLFAAFAIITASTAPALAKPSIETVSVHVSYADLDLTTTAGAKALKRRVKSAVNQVCGHAGESASRGINRRITACHRDAMELARGSVTDPLVASVLWAEHTRIAGR